MNFVHAAHVIFGANICPVPHSTQEKYNIGILSN